MINNRSLTSTLGIALFIGGLGLVVNGLFELVLIQARLADQGAFELVVFIKQWLAATLLVVGILLASVQRCLMVFYPRLITLVVITLLLLLSSVMVRYSVGWSIQWAGDYYGWMMEKGITIYYINGCYLIAVLLFIAISQLVLKAVNKRVDGQLLAPTVGHRLVAVSCWLTGLTLFHSNELIESLAIALAIDLHIAQQYLFRLVSVICLLGYLASQLVVVIFYRTKIVAHERSLVVLGVIVWIVPLLMVDTIRLLVAKLMHYLGSGIALMLFYLLVLVVTCLVLYLFYNKYHSNKTES